MHLNIHVLTRVDQKQTHREIKRKEKVAADLCHLVVNGDTNFCQINSCSKTNKEYLLLWLITIPSNTEVIPLLRSIPIQLSTSGVDCEHQSSDLLQSNFSAPSYTSCLYGVMHEVKTQSYPQNLYYLHHLGRTRLDNVTFCLASRPIYTERPDNFGNILLIKAFSWKYLKEKCWSEAKNQLSFKYFVNFRLIRKLFSKVWE